MVICQLHSHFIRRFLCKTVITIVLPGPFENDKYHGLGAYRHFNGDVFAGHYVHGLREGRGVMCYHDTGKKSSSDWKNDISQNVTTVKSRDGKRTIKGVFEDNRFVNPVTVIDNSPTAGFLYTGDVRKDKMHGFGKLTAHDKSDYEGTYCCICCEVCAGF